MMQENDIRYFCNHKGKDSDALYYSNLWNNIWDRDGVLNISLISRYKSHILSFGYEIIIIMEYFIIKIWDF